MVVMKRSIISILFISLIFVVPIMGISQGDALFSTSSGDEYMVVLSDQDCYALKMQRGAAHYGDNESGSVYTPDQSSTPKRVGSALTTEECIAKAAKKLK